MAEDRFEPRTIGTDRPHRPSVSSNARQTGDKANVNRPASHKGAFYKIAVKATLDHLRATWIETRPGVFKIRIAERNAGSRSDHNPPQAKRPKLIVVVAFDRSENGELFPAFGPADQRSEERAIRTAMALVNKHAGVLAWSRDANPDVGEYGPPTTLFVSGDVPDMD